jgi:hypothetical protein
MPASVQVEPGALPLGDEARELAHAVPPEMDALP